MPRKFFSRISRQYRRKQDSQHPWYLRPLEYIHDHPVYFAPTRRSVSGGLAVGVFVGLLPIPGQTPVALLLAWLARVNVPVALVTIWISNPITFVPIFYLSYRLGAALLNVPTEPFPDEFTFEWLSGELALRWKPLIYGSFILAVSAASITYLVISSIWHGATVYRYRRRHGKRRNHSNKAQ